MIFSSNSNVKPVLFSRRQTNLVFIAVCAVGVLLAVLWHISVGARSIPMSVVYNGLFHFNDQEFLHIVVRDMRFPRALMAILIGASLSVAGALMQGVTRNPLAEPGLLGLLAGASFAVVLVVGVFNWVSPTWIPVVAAAGSLMAAVLVWAMAAYSPSGVTPLSLTLSGAVLTLFLGALISIAHLLNHHEFEQLRIWLAGSLTSVRTNYLPSVAPILILSILFSIALSSRLTVFAMGEQTAHGLGVNVARLRLQCLACVVLLTAGSVTLAGPIGFLGLVVPHTVRLLVGADYRWIIPVSAIFGGLLLVVIDTIARVIIAPQEIATGILTALIGAPLFVYLVRRRA